MLFWQILGTCLSIAGVYALSLSWQRKTRHWPLVLSGWGAILGAILAWAQTSGVDKGPALGIIVVVLTAMIGVFIVALRTPVKQRREPKARALGSANEASVWHEGLSTTASILAIVIIGLIAAMASCTAFFMGSRALGMEHTANLSLTMFAFPMVWAALATYVGYSTSVLGRATFMAGLTVLSGGVIFASM